MEFSIWVHNKPEYLESTEYKLNTLTSPVRMALGTCDKNDDRARETINIFALWALRKLLAACVKVAWWCGLALAKRLFERTSRKDKPPCDHEFFKCQVPAGDSCVAIYHDVCRKCRWDKRKGIYMPADIWEGWALPQLEKLDFKWDTTKAGSKSLDWREWTTPPTGLDTTTAGET